MAEMMVCHFQDEFIKDGVTILLVLSCTFSLRSLALRKLILRSNLYGEEPKSLVIGHKELGWEWILQPQSRPQELQLLTILD